MFADGTPEHEVQQKYMKIMDMVFDNVAAPLGDAEASISRVYQRLMLTPTPNVYQQAKAATRQGQTLQSLLTRLKYIQDEMEQLNRHLDWMVHVPVPVEPPPPSVAAAASFSPSSASAAPKLAVAAANSAVDEDALGDMLNDLVDGMGSPRRGATSPRAGASAAAVSPTSQAKAAPAPVKPAAAVAAPAVASAPVAAAGGDDDDIDVGIIVPPAKPKPVLSFTGMPMSPDEIDEFKRFQVWKYENEQRENLVILRQRKIEEAKKARAANG